MEGIVSSNGNSSRDKNENGIGVVGRLDIGGFDLVLDLSDALEFFANGLGALELGAFEGHHAFVGL